MCNEEGTTSVWEILASQEIRTVRLIKIDVAETNYVVMQDIVFTIQKF